MNISCKFCSSSNFVKDGIVNNGNQRYKCKECSRRFTVTKRKYDYQKKLKIIKMYLEGIGIRSIERLEGVSNELIIYWIRKIDKILKERIESNETLKEKKKDIIIMEIGELVTYVKKKSLKYGYGLQLIEKLMKY
jgi:transposase-like protein